MADDRPLTVELVPAAKLLGMHPETLKKLAVSGEVPGAKLGRRWVFVEADLLTHIRANYAPKAVLPWQKRKTSTSGKKVASGTSISATLGIGYVAQLESLIARKPKRSVIGST